MELFLTQAAAEEFGDRVRAVAPDVRFWSLLNDGTIVGPEGPIAPTEVRPEVAWGTADLFAPDAPIRRFFGVVAHAPSLRWFQSPSAGFDLPVFAAIVGRGVRLTSAHVNSVGIAEYVLRGVLDHFQRAQVWRDGQRARRWELHEFREVAGSTWLIVGLGSIGAAVATRARAFGARVLGVRRHPTGDEPADEVHTPDELGALLPRADVIVICAPATAATASLVDEGFLAAMRPDAVLVNVARGALVDEAALRRALDAGRPAAALLDVTATEPLPADSWLWDHPRVVLTPHNAATGHGRFARAADLFCDNLARYREGRPLRHEVTEADLG